MTALTLLSVLACVAVAIFIVNAIGLPPIPRSVAVGVILVLAFVYLMTGSIG